MKVVELRKKPKKELQRTILDLQEKIRELRFNLASGKVKNIKEIRRIRKDIARILTILKEKKD